MQAQGHDGHVAHLSTHASRAAGAGALFIRAAARRADDVRDRTQVVDRLAALRRFAGEAGSGFHAG